MSEQTIQNDLYSNPVTILDKYTCYSLGATTVKDLMNQGTIKRRALSSNIGKKPDVLIVDKDKHVKVYLELKQPKEFNSKAKIKKAIEQELQVAKDIQADIFVATDGSKFVWINPKTGNPILDEIGNPLTYEIKPKTDEKHLASLINRISLSISDTNDKLYDIVDSDPTPLAIRVGAILKNIKFTTPKDSLYTFVEIFLFKYLSDINILQGLDSFDSIYSLYSHGISKEEVLYKYLNGPRIIMNTLFPVAPDNTTIINGTIFHAFIDSDGNYRCNGTDASTFYEVLKQFVTYENEHGKFIHINRDFKSKLFETFTKQEKIKQHAGKYFTPLKIVQGMVDMVSIKEGMHICDPACGVGKFLLEAAIKINNPFTFESGHVKKKVLLHGFEKEMDEMGTSSGYDLTTILAKANTLIYFSNLFSENNNRADIQTIATELLNDTYYSSKTILGTLDNIEYNKYDVILANPPYYQSKIISDEAKATSLYTEGGSGVEGLFVEWIIKSLKPGGEANIVVPDGIMLNLQNGRLHNYIIKKCYVESIISLPLNTFFNTPKKTFILTLRKKHDERERQGYPIFTYICSSIGEQLDINRFDIDDDDFHEAVSKYVHYNACDKNNIPGFIQAAFDADPRLKFIDISYLEEELVWDIDRLWTDDEKIAMGIKNPEFILTLGEFNDKVSETISLLEEYKGELECLI